MKQFDHFLVLGMIGLSSLSSAFASASPQQSISQPSAVVSQPNKPEDSKTMSKDTKEAKHPIVLIKTSMGDITVELYPEKAPITVKNFLQYVDEGAYDHTIFHRIISGFMIQGGGFTKSMEQKKTRAPIKNEANNGLSNKRGTIAMARTGVVDSATAQFFVNTVDNPFLDYRGSSPSEYGYAVFGKVISGMDVVDKIRAVKTGAADVPVDTVEIISAKQTKTNH